MPAPTSSTAAAAPTRCRASAATTPITSTPPATWSFEAAGGGNDIVYASASYTLGAGQSVEMLSTASHGATTAINLTGNNLANTLIGNAGANMLDGGGGADTLQGLGGNDSYLVDIAGDQVFEAAGGGNDPSMRSVSYALAPASRSRC